ncbi:MAG: hypothetical protein RLZZ623_281 [Actinomycetota bacterium]|jgi:RES domain
MTAIVSTAPPPDGFWRVGRSGSVRPEFRRPLRVDDTNQLGGNRFDSFTGTYGTLYFGTTLEVCFAETLARFRPKSALLVLVDEEWDANGWMRPGNVAADWRLGRVIQRSAIDEPLPFVDIDHPDTLATLNTIPELMAGLTRFGIEDLDLGVITGRDRRVTRFVAEFLYDSTDAEGNAAWGGIRYMSRLGEGWECWAVFEGAEIRDVERRSVGRIDPDLLAVAERYRLTIH